MHPIAESVRSDTFRSPKLLESVEMKMIKAAVLASLVATPSLAGGMAEPVMEPEVVVEEAAGSSAGGILVPILALVLIAAVASN